MSEMKNVGTLWLLKYYRGFCHLGRPRKRCRWEEDSVNHPFMCCSPGVMNRMDGKIREFGLESHGEMSAVACRAAVVAANYG